MTTTAANLEREVWQRAGGACEYCHMSHEFYRIPFQLDHIVAQQHGGATTSDNLCLCCFHCNLHKGPNIASIDPQTQQLARLFHPRRDQWDEHFAWQAHELVGLTPIGRATIRCLAINDAEYRAVRAALLLEGVFPPQGPR